MKAQMAKKRTARPKRTPTAALSPLFVVGAARVLIGRGANEPAIRRHLEAALHAVTPTFAADNFIAGNDSFNLLEVALRMGNRARVAEEISTRADLLATLKTIMDRGAGIDSEDELNVRFRTTEDGIYVGLVAGYLLAHMTGGVR